MREIKFKVVYHLNNGKKKLTKPFTLNDILISTSEKYGDEKYICGYRNRKVEINSSTILIQYTGKVGLCTFTLAT